MKELLNQLQTLEGIEQRSSVSVIRELNLAIEMAQSSGYKVAAIHQEITKFMTIGLDSFKTLLYRVRRENQVCRQKAKPSVLKIPRTKTQPMEVQSEKNQLEFNRETATQRSKNKLAQFGKGK